MSKEIKVFSYTAVPTTCTSHVAVEERPTRKSLLGLFWSLVALAFIVALFFDDEIGNQQQHYMRHRHHDDKSNSTTKLAGGGRDWLVNAVDGTIHAKHDPSLVLGVDTSYPLVLVQRGSLQELHFGPPPKNEQSFLPFQDAKFGVVVGDKQHIGDYHVRETKLSPNSSDALVSYQQDNFIVLENSKSSCPKHKMVLDVSEWNMRKGQAVNFVEGPHWDTFKSIGGGRDFVWNSDGSIATKLNPQLVLGKAEPRMVLVNEKSPNKLAFRKAQDLANGNSVEMTLVGGGAIRQRYSEAREYGPWHYIESQVNMEEENEGAVVALYDGNFILVNGGKLALDVAFWDLKEGMPVNFVGGDDDSEANAEELVSKVQPKSLLRASESSSDSSPSSSSTSNDDSSESVNSIEEYEYDNEDGADGEEDEADDVELDVALVLTEYEMPVREDRVINRLDAGD